jgi:hypothetical protein
MMPVAASGAGGGVVLLMLGLLHPDDVVRMS